MICIATTTPDINSTKERPVAATLALLQIRLALWLGNNKPGRRNIVGARNFRHDTGGPRSSDEGGQIAGTSQPCRPAHESDRQACRAYRIRASLVRFEGDRICYIQGPWGSAEGGVAHSAAVPANRVGVVAPGSRHGVRRRGRHVWFGRTSGRVAGIHRDYVAIDRRHSAKRGRGSV